MKLIAAITVVICLAPFARAEEATEVSKLRTEIEQLKAQQLEREQDLKELLRICRSLSLKIEFANKPMRQAIEDYLTTRGITGLTLSDANLEPLDRVLRRSMWSAELNVGYNSWKNALSLDSTTERLDYLQTMANIHLGFALVDGPELNFEFHATPSSEGLLGSSPTDALSANPLRAVDPTLRLPDGDDPELFCAYVRTEPFNLLGRLAHIPVTLIAGRQPLPDGREFLLSSKQNEFGLSFDGLMLLRETGHGTRVNVFALQAAGGATRLASQITPPADPASTPDIKIAGTSIETDGLLPDSLFALQAFWTNSSPIAGAGIYANIPSLKLFTLAVESITELTSQTKLTFNFATQTGHIGGVDVKDNLAGALALERKKDDECSKVFVAFGEGDDTSTSENETFIPIGQKSIGLWDNEGLFSTRNAIIGGLSYSKAFGLYELNLRATTAFAIDSALPTGQLTSPGALGSGNHVGELYTVQLSRAMQSESASKVEMRLSYFVDGDYFAPSSSPSSMISFRFSSSF